MKLRWYARREKPDWHPHDIGAFGYLAWSEDGYNVWVTMQFLDTEEGWVEVPVVDESELEGPSEITPTAE